MKKHFGFAAFLSLSLVVPFVGCGGGNGPASNSLTGGEQTLTFGNVVTRLVGTAQQPVYASGSGASVVGLGGGTVSNLLFKSSAPTLASTRIVFQHLAPDGFYHIYTMNIDGSNITQLTNDPTTDRVPRWSLDGTKIVFERNSGGNRDIWVMNADGSQLQNLTNSSDYEGGPIWSPDGTKIAFFKGPGNNIFDMWVMNADGSNPQNITKNPGSNYPGSWSPDGKKIAFYNHSGRWVIYTINIDGTNLTPITPLDQDSYRPAYSPDGTKIAFDTYLTNRFQVCVMNDDGSGQKNLSNSASSDDHPTWSPDGTKIVFSSNRNRARGSSIYTMNADGSNQTRLTDDGTTSENTDWGPFIRQRNYIGTDGTMGTAAAGFLLGQKGKDVTSVVTFDTAAVATRTNARVTSQSGNAPGQSNYLFTVTASDSLKSLAYLNGVSGSPTVVIGTGGGVASATGAIVSFDSSDGTVAAVLPYTANRAASDKATHQLEGNVQILRGSFRGVWDSKGLNRAPGGASEVRLDAKTGAVLSVQ